MKFVVLAYSNTKSNVGTHDSVKSASFELLDSDSNVKTPDNYKVRGLKG